MDKRKKKSFFCSYNDNIKALDPQSHIFDCDLNKPFGLAVFTIRKHKKIKKN